MSTFKCSSMWQRNCANDIFIYIFLCILPTHIRIASSHHTRNIKRGCQTPRVAQLRFHSYFNRPHHRGTLLLYTHPKNTIHTIRVNKTGISPLHTWPDGVMSHTKHTHMCIGKYPFFYDEQWTMCWAFLGRGWSSGANIYIAPLYNM